MHAKFYSWRPTTGTSTEGRFGSAWIRQFHRWVAIVFTTTVLANFAAMTRGQPPTWIVYSPLVPLFLLLFTGLYMFVLPYLKRGDRS